MAVGDERGHGIGGRPGDGGAQRDLVVSVVEYALGAGQPAPGRAGAEAGGPGLPGLAPPAGDGAEPVVADGKEAVRLPGSGRAAGGASRVAGRVALFGVGDELEQFRPRPARERRPRRSRLMIATDLPQNRPEYRS